MIVDSVQAGVRDVVLVMDEGNGARQVLNWEDARSVLWRWAPWIG
jgi:hypothetical protein